MSNTGKITFGNNAATTYSANNTNFGYVSGDNVGGSYSPYSQQQQPLSTTINAVSAAGYGGIQQQRSTSPTIQRGNVGQSLLNTYTSGQTVTPVTTSFQNKQIPISSTQGGKITFGGKQFTSQFTPQTRYETTTTNYVAQPINNYQTYQTYQSYQRPVEIAPVIATQHIQSQPIREEVQVVQQKYQQPIVQRKSSKVEATPYRESTTGSSVKKSKKGGCPAWLWPMLGILALLALILGLLFGLGVFGRIGGANVQKQGEISTVAGANITTPTTTVDTGAGVSTTQQPQGGYTVIDETVVVSKNDTTTTTGVTSPTVVDTTYTTAPVVPVTSVDTTYTTTTGVPTTTTTVSEDEFAIDPASFAPTPVATTNTQYYTTSSNVPTTTYSTDSTVYTTTPYAAGTTYPTVSGYGSNPEFEYVQPTTSAQ